MIKFSFEKAVKVWNLPGFSLEERQQLLTGTGWTFAELMLEHIKRQDAVAPDDSEEGEAK